jgi:hypothetical protein
MLPSFREAKNAHKNYENQEPAGKLTISATAAGAAALNLFTKERVTNK